jgi:hypothetical protein
VRTWLCPAAAERLVVRLSGRDGMFSQVGAGDRIRTADRPLTSELVPRETRKTVRVWLVVFGVPSVRRNYDQTHTWHVHDIPTIS